MAEAFQANTLKDLETELTQKLDGITTTFYNAVRTAIGPSRRGTQSIGGEEGEIPYRQEPRMAFSGEGPGRLPWLKERPQQQPQQQSQSSAQQPSQASGTGNTPSLRDLLGFGKWMFRGGPWRNLPGKQHESVTHFQCFREVDRITQSMFDFLVTDATSQQDIALAHAFDAFNKGIRSVVFAYMQNAHQLGKQNAAMTADKKEADRIKSSGDKTLKANSNWLYKNRKQIKKDTALTLAAWLEDTIGIELDDLDAIQQVLEKELGYVGTAADAVARIKIKRDEASGAIGTQRVSSSKKKISNPAAGTTLIPLEPVPLNPDEHQRHISGGIDFEEDD